MNQLTELRNIIVGEQQEELQLLKDRLEQTRIDPEKLAIMLPEAFRLTESVNNSMVANEMQPYMSKSVIRAVEDDPHGFAEVLYPALVPAIRLMLMNAIKAFTRRINTTIESTTTAQGLKWRFEAMRTGESYSEVVMRKTLDYRVEQLYLLKSDSGVLIEHLVNEDIGSIDSDAVAAMFSAIQSFVRDSFNSEDGENLNQISVGDLNVWLVHRPRVTLACVVRGSIPFQLRDRLDAVQDSIFSRYARQIKEFDGSQNQILGIRELLEPCLELRLKTEATKKKKAPLASFLILISVLAAIAYWSFASLQQQRMQRNVENLLFVTPGILPTEVKWDKRRLIVVGLKDPDAKIPWEKLKEYGVEVDKIDLSLKTLKSFQPIKTVKPSY
ncbi:MAG: hypothetical protein ACRBEE_00750 [Arenicella sp.]